MIETTRVQWIDIAKVIGIYLVVLGHLPVNTRLFTLIYSFHMPLFFFLSGILFKTGDDKFIVRYIRKLLVGYVLYTLLTFCYYFLISRVGYNLYRLEQVVWWKRITGALYGVASNTDYFRMLNTPLWYLLAAVCVVLIYKFISKFKSTQHQLLATFFLAIVGFILSKYDTFRLPWSLDVSCIVFPFFYMGVLFKRLDLSIPRINLIWYFIVLVVFIDLSLFNGKSILAHKLYGNNYILMYIVGFLGILLTIKFCLLAQSCINDRLYTFIKTISDNTLMILGLHYIQFWIFAEIVYKYCKINIFVANTKWALLISLVVMAVNIGLIICQDNFNRLKFLLTFCIKK